MRLPSWIVPSALVALVGAALFSSRRPVNTPSLRPPPLPIASREIASAVGVWHVWRVRGNSYEYLFGYSSLRDLFAELTRQIQSGAGDFVVLKSGHPGMGLDPLVNAESPWYDIWYWNDIESGSWQYYEQEATTHVASSFLRLSGPDSYWWLRGHV